MTNKNYILELAVFTVKPEFVEKLPEIRRNFASLLKGFDGLQDIQSFNPVSENNTFADVMKWDSLENASVAMSMFKNKDERVLPYMQAIEEMKFMGYFES